MYFCFTCVDRPEFHWFKSPYFFAVVVVVAAAAAAAAVGLMTVLFPLVSLLFAVSTAAPTNRFAVA